MRLAILVTHPVQYFAPVFRELAQYTNLELKVFFGCDHGTKHQEDQNFGVSFKWDCEPTIGYDHECLSNSSIKDLAKSSGVKVAFQALYKINKYKPDVVLIFSYAPIFITLSTLLLRIAGYRLMLRAETTDEALSRSTIKDNLRKWILTSYYRQFKHFFPIGTNSWNHYQRMGISSDNMSTAFYAIDVEFFQKQIDLWQPQRAQLRAAAGIKPQDKVLIYCGKMFSDKNPLLIPQALGLLSQEEKKNLWFIAVGDGELRSDFEKAAKRELGSRSLFVGFKNQSQLGEYYAMADILILPSRKGETWGLVVNEALQFGLRVIVSDKVGSSKDLISSTNQGSKFISGDSQSLADSINFVIQEESESDFKMKLPHPIDLSNQIYIQIKDLTKTAGKSQ